MFDVKVAKSHFSLFDMFRTNRFKKKDILDNPDRFYSFGVILLCGELGSGKSLTAHRLIKQFLEYKPDILVCSNVNIPFADNFVPYTGLQDFKILDNKDKGIILFIDEIMNQFPSTLSKDISDDWITLLALLRKKRCLIIGTGPMFSRIAKPFRETFEYVCLCDCFFGKYGALIQNNHWFKCNVENKIIGTGDSENTFNMQEVKHQVFTIQVDDLIRYDTAEMVKVVESQDRKGRLRYG